MTNRVHTNSRAMTVSGEELTAEGAESAETKLMIPLGVLGG